MHIRFNFPQQTVGSPVHQVLIRLPLCPVISERAVPGHQNEDLAPLVALIQGCLGRW